MRPAPVETERSHGCFHEHLAQVDSAETKGSDGAVQAYSFDDIWKPNVCQKSSADKSSVADIFIINRARSPPLVLQSAKEVVAGRNDTTCFPAPVL